MLNKDMILSTSSLRYVVNYKLIRFYKDFPNIHLPEYEVTLETIRDEHDNNLCKMIPDYKTGSFKVVIHQLLFTGIEASPANIMRRANQSFTIMKNILTINPNEENIMMPDVYKTFLNICENGFNMTADEYYNKYKGVMNNEN